MKLDAASELYRKGYDCGYQVGETAGYDKGYEEAMTYCIKYAAAALTFSVIIMFGYLVVL